MHSRLNWTRHQTTETRMCAFPSAFSVPYPAPGLKISPQEGSSIFNLQEASLKRRMLEAMEKAAHGPEAEKIWDNAVQNSIARAEKSVLDVIQKTANGVEAQNSILRAIETTANGKQAETIWKNASEKNVREGAESIKKAIVTTANGEEAERIWKEAAEKNMKSAKEKILHFFETTANSAEAGKIWKEASEKHVSQALLDADVMIENKISRKVEELVANKMKSFEEYVSSKIHQVICDKRDEMEVAEILDHMRDREMESGEAEKVPKIRQEALGVKPGSIRKRFEKLSYQNHNNVREFKFPGKCACGKMLLTNCGGTQRHLIFCKDQMRKVKKAASFLQKGRRSNQKIFEGEPGVERVRKLLHYRPYSQGKGGEYLVWWAGHSYNKNSWVDENDITSDIKERYWRGRRA